jgi:hypothetical protein
VTAPNHALTGALIGLSVANPVLALPLAFLSHLVQDAVPHYDPAEADMAKRISARSFVYQQLVLGGALCVLLVAVLAIIQPAHWFLASVCAFLATSADMFWIPRFMHVQRTGKDLPPTNWFLRLHSALQWKTGPNFFWVEVVWFLAFCTIIATHLW